MNSDVLIIGAGVIGLSIARELSRRGIAKITVVERGKAGREASWAAAGMLAPQAETDKINEFFSFCSASRDLYPEFAAELKAETGVDIELEKSGTLYLAFSDHDMAEIERRFEWQRSAGMKVERLHSDECLSLEPSISRSVLGGLYFPNDWQVENRKLVVALIEFARLNNIEIVENVSVDRITIDKHKVATVEASDGSLFSAGQVILATGAWTSLIKIGELSLPIEVKPIRGQMICFEASEQPFRHVIYGPNGYIVPRADSRILAGATVEDVGFEPTTTDTAIASLLEAAVEISPSFEGLAITEKWAGLRPFAADGHPVIGRLAMADNLFVATGHYRNGILLAPLTARCVAEAIVENANSPFLTSFGPHRFRAAGRGW